MTGTVYIKRFMALALLCAVAASVVTVPAIAGVVETTATPKVLTAPAPLRITCKKLEPTLNVVQFDCTTNVKTTAVLNIGTDKQYGLRLKDRLKTRHLVRVPALRPDTQYYCLVVVTSKSGKTKRKPCAFKTEDIGPATLGSKSGKLLAGGSPLFPFFGLVSSCVDEKMIADNQSLGALILDSTVHSCPGGSRAEVVQRHHELLDRKLWLRAAEASYAQQLEGLPELIKLPANIVFKTDPSSLLGCGSRSSLGFYNVLQTASVTLPVIGWVTVGSPLGPSSRICVTPQRTRNLVYVAVLAGADGVEWNTSNPLDASAGFSVKPEVTQEAKKLTGELATLQPVFLLGKRMTIAPAPLGSVKIEAWSYGGSTYIIAVNTEDAANIAAFSVKGVTRPRLEFLGKRGSLTARNGVFTDRFAPLAVKIYRFAP